MADEVTLQNPRTGRIVRTDNAESISNLRYARGFRVIETPGTPAVPQDAAAPPGASSGQPADDGTKDEPGPAIRGVRR